MDSTPAASAAPSSANGGHAAPERKFGDAKEQTKFGLTPFVFALGLPYLNSNAPGEWETETFQWVEAATKSAASAKRYTLHHKGQPLKLQFNWLKVTFTRDNSQFRTALSPLEAAAEQPHGFEELGSKQLESVLRLMRESARKFLSERAPERELSTNFLAQPKPQYPPSLTFSYHIKTASVWKVKPSALTVYDDSKKASVERDVIKGGIHAPICRVQVSEPNAEGEFFIHFAVDQSAVITKPELVPASTPEREKAWLEAALAKLSGCPLHMAMLKGEPASPAVPAPAPVAEEEKAKKKAAPKKKRAAEGEEVVAKPAVTKKPRAPRKKKGEELPTLEGPVDSTFYSDMNAPEPVTMGDALL